jgi:hypothetical protein
MTGEKNNPDYDENQNNRNEKQDATPDAAHDVLLFRMGCGSV